MSVQTPSKPAETTPNPAASPWALRLQNIQNCAQGYEAIAAEISRLEKLEPELRAEAKALVDAMGHEVSLNALLSAKPKGEQFDSATDQKIRTLHVIETKLRLMPGAKARLQAKLNELWTHIESDSRSIFLEGLHRARAQAEELFQTELARLSQVCGGNRERATKAARAIVENSEHLRWKDFFETAHPDPIGGPANIVPYVVRYAEKFERGEPVSDLKQS